MRKSINKITLGAVAVAALALSACMSSGSNPASANNSAEGLATVVLTAKTETFKSLNKPGLGKASAVTLSRIVITAVSDKAPPRAFGEDSVVIEKSVGQALGSGTFLGSTTADQTFTGVILGLRPLRNWTIKVETFDAVDDTIQRGTLSLGAVYAGDTVSESITAKPLYANYKATVTFADSITSETGTITRQDLSIKRAKLFVDNVEVAVLTGSPLLAADIAHELLAEKVKINAGNTVKVELYGYLPEAAGDLGNPALFNLLYLGTKSITQNEAENGGSGNITLAWQGPTSGVGDLSVTVQKVGLTEIEVETPPEVLPKK